MPTEEAVEACWPILAVRLSFSKGGTVSSLGRLHLVIDIESKRLESGTPNREPQEYSRNVIEYKDPGIYYIPTLNPNPKPFGVPCLGFPVKSL